ncbi:hypothetical protein DOTSEDRAFT_75965 [Dothistroma septosporum NZE10]|uniref:Cyanovirin-N domain-containing protein n=1 Tax=Dothistroma septosporum (strain NZE10 / CBS 128990) TaxID=675120 RepID=M2WHI9_DOTSN|nr:hypothetical protein DOTSEDRAFT_75965 [Dothistroma septosporum NZE10]
MASSLRLWRCFFLLSSLLSFTSAQKHDGWWYALNFRRYDGTNCWVDGKARNKGTHVSAKNHCVSWEGEAQLTSFSTGWLWRYKDDHFKVKQSDYGRCDLHVWEKSGCKGGPIGVLSTPTRRAIAVLMRSSSPMERCKSTTAWR